LETEEGEGKPRRAGRTMMADEEGGRDAGGYEDVVERAAGWMGEETKGEREGACGRFRIR
jgi:hypothetical protein